MKKLVATLTACTCLGLSTISVSATSTETSGGVNLDPILKEYREQGSVDGQMRSLSTAPRVAVPWKDADGGQFRVLWSGNTHTSQFDHNYKSHGCSASNSHSTRYSEWEAPGDRAEIWIYSTTGGNKGNWSTDHWS
ncbi:lactococcin 972 family bacteriocin [Bacillus clarus]|nr:lactococcin 972 family bacteriocin [Bacillus clarus]